MNYLFFLGRTIDLCTAELEVVLKRFNGELEPSFITNQIAKGSFEKRSAEQLISILGGTQKIAEIVEELSSTQIKEALDVCARKLAEANQGKKAQFAISIIGEDTEIVPEKYIKGELKKYGMSSRFVQGEALGLNAAQFKHNHAEEYFIVKHEDLYLIAKTAGIQDVDDWSKRDFGKPYRDAKRGMLPPKLARMLVNLAIGDKSAEQVTLLDPFCGSGTILMESLLIGTEAVGSDISQEAVLGAGKNLLWLKEQWGLQKEYSLSVQDASHLTQQTLVKRFNAVATEPFLGKQNPTMEAANNILKGLEKMYLGFLKSLGTILPKGSNVAIIVPQLTFGKSVKNMHSLIDRVGSLGYTREKGPFLYTRPQTVVQREIYVLRKI